MRSTSISAPHGTCASRCLTRASSSVSGSEPGTMRIEIFARASGTKTFDDPAMLVMSTPIALIDGFAQRRDATGPEPTMWLPSSRSALDLRSSGLNAAPSHSPVVTPGTATVPSSSTRLASIRASAIMASGAAPPNRPEWSGCWRVRTVTMHATSPRSAVVSTGSPTLRLPMSHTMNRSQSNRSGCASTNGSRLLAVSSIPSTMSLIVQGGLPSKICMVPRWIASPPLSSAAPRP